VTSWSVTGLESDLERFHLGPIDLDLAPGRVVAVLGNSGAGKTTLLRTLAGFLPARAGAIRRDGVDLTVAPPERRRLGYVPQGLGLFPHRTVERNVSYPLEMRAVLDWKRRTRALLERFDLVRLADRRPARLSGGEMQRVALARALAAQPELLLWDEPWQALDVEARHALDLVFEELRATERVPVVLVTHDPALAFSAADTFLVLRAGRAHRVADAATLLAHPLDAFTARFVGYANVVDPPTLAAAAPGTLYAWLAARAGPEGVAFARPTLEPGGSGAWSGVIRTVHPTPEGIALSLRVDGALVAARSLPPSGGALPAAGAAVRFDVPEGSVHPLG